MSEKDDYLVVYDYGMGGVWAVVCARSKDEIAAKYPFLTVQKCRPEWMTDDCYTKIMSARHFDIDDRPLGWLASVAKEE